MSRRSIVIIITTTFVVLVGLLIYWLIPKTQLLFSVAPHEVTVTIDGQEKLVTNGLKMRVNPGKYKVTISHDQFESYSLSVAAKKGNTTEVLVALTPKNDAARALLGNQESQNILQRFTDVQAQDYKKQMSKAYPIIDILPIQQRLYYIYPCPSQKYPNDNNKLAVCVDITTDEIKPYVENYVKSKGYDLNDYEVIWVQDSQTNQGD